MRANSTVLSSANTQAAAVHGLSTGPPHAPGQVACFTSKAAVDGRGWNGGIYGVTECGTGAGAQEELRAGPGLVPQEGRPAQCFCRWETEASPAGREQASGRIGWREGWVTAAGPRSLHGKGGSNDLTPQASSATHGFLTTGTSGQSPGTLATRRHGRAPCHAFYVESGKRL